jgi:hypothetical protein
VTLGDTGRISFTPESATCEDVHQQIKDSERQLKTSLRTLGNIEGKADFLKHTELLKPFHQAKMLYDKMGCNQGEGAKPIMTDSFRNRMVAKLKGVWMQHSSEDEATAKARFENLLEFIKDKSQDASLKDLIKASNIAFGTTAAEDVDEDGIDEEADENIDPVDAEALEDKLASSITGQNNSSLVQVDENQVAGSKPPWYVVLAGFVVLVAVGLFLWILFMYVVFYLFVAALCLSLGILGIYSIQQGLKSMKDSFD